ncbi:MAG: RtcB family protein [Bacteroides sp.]|nr:RtcB family protein [Bacteroides sp.]MDD4721059.1 RtcB family protein [Bacteroides sp.]
MQIIQTKNMRLPLYTWLDQEDIEESCMQQVVNLSNLPFAYHHIALMPDAHTGYGMPIGGVLATIGEIIPNAVGVDIGCGMMACKTNIQNYDIHKIEQIINSIKQSIPVGHQWRKKPLTNKLPDYSTLPVVKKHAKDALLQLGTLGGGNHFIELQKDKDNYLWVMVHSGSRNIGKQVADYYNKIAVQLNKKENSPVPKSHSLAHLSMNSSVGKTYLKEMQFCVDFAKLNRDLMFQEIQNVLVQYYPSISFGEIINIEHNYARVEKHFGKTVIVHRKGATFAGKDNLGIIPGSQGTKSFIVKGKGNENSFDSCSHGAGRLMGRMAAKRNLNLQEEKKALDDMGIVHSVHRTRDLDEAPSAYKDIVEVMASQKDLVDIEVELFPLGVVKG